MAWRGWRMLVSAGLLVIATQVHAQAAGCDMSAVLGGFQAAVQQGAVDTWAQTYSECPDQTQRGVNALVHGYDTLSFEAPTFETVIEFDGVDDYVEVPFSEDLNLDEFTLETWIYVEETPDFWQYIAGKTGSDGYSSNYVMVILPYSLTVRAALMSGNCSTSVGMSSQEALIEDAWNHVAITYDGESIRFYLNGTLDSDIPYNGTTCQSENSLYIGGTSGPYGMWQGQMAEVRLWNHALDLAELRAGMHTALTGSESGLVSYWRGDTPKGRVIPDAAGQNPAVRMSHGR